ncbi:MAG TPA: alpha/beta hydrolase [Thermoanaerobaculia bacterium]|nr:alpha/beta hydrolase [Thermoanaerobaculia bacterium]
MKSVAGLFAGFLTSACCASLPNLPQKRTIVLPAPSGSHRVQESSAVWRDESRSRDVPVRIYAPADVAPAPVVIFSHGIGEDRDSYAYLGRALAANGFMAVHVTHAGTDKAVLRQGYWKLYRATKKPENWRSRPLDITFVLDKLSERHDVDMTRVAVAGHSAGAFTAFALAGARAPNGEMLLDRRVRVIVPMSAPRFEGISYEEIAVPALNITGTCDSSIIYRTRQRHRRIPFEQTGSPHQYLVTIEGVNHDVFSNATDPHHAVIVRLTISFLRAWLLDDGEALAWFDDAGTAEVENDRLTVERRAPSRAGGGRGRPPLHTVR